MVLLINPIKRYDDATSKQGNSVLRHKSIYEMVDSASSC